MTIDNLKISDVAYFEKMLLAKALKHPAERKKLRLQEKHFEDEKHGIIYSKLMNDLTVEPEDLLTESVRNPEKFGDYEFIRGIINFPIPTKHGILNDQIQVYEFYKQRVVKSKIEEYNEKPTSERAIEISKTVDSLEEFNLEGNDSKINVLSDIMDDLYGENQSSVIRTGFNALDNIISGFEPQQLNVVAARPSMGKTAFALGLAINLAMQGNEVLFLSLESTEKNITQRILSNIAKVDLYKFKKPQDRMSEKEIERVIEAMDVYNKLPIKVVEQAKLTPNILRRMINNMPDDAHCFVMIDYLTLMESDSKHNSRYEEVTNVSRELKKITQAMPNVTMIALAQLNRGVDQRQDKRPIMSDLRDSGQIEQDSSMIMMLYRDDYENNEVKTDKSTLEVIVRKNKDGGLGTAELDFYKSIQKLY